MPALRQKARVLDFPPKRTQRCLSNQMFTNTQKYRISAVVVKFLKLVQRRIINLKGYIFVTTQSRHVDGESTPEATNANPSGKSEQTVPTHLNKTSVCVSRLSCLHKPPFFFRALTQN